MYHSILKSISYLTRYLVKFSAEWQKYFLKYETTVWLAFIYLHLFIRVTL